MAALLAPPHPLGWLFALYLRITGLTTSGSSNPVSSMLTDTRMRGKSSFLIPRSWPRRWPYRLRRFPGLIRRSRHSEPQGRVSCRQRRHRAAAPAWQHDALSPRKRQSYRPRGTDKHALGFHHGQRATVPITKRVISLCAVWQDVFKPDGPTVCGVPLRIPQLGAGDDAREGSGCF
jgi:hypothetical protein